ncbi:DNA mismatch repair protein MutL [Methylacidimicrobium cyclopophantes]|uniref:DNA mismatch repair protein MutL n=1 Tax=Methylacidimicrobium cyclopophantes TaxID=1041766 RepID=A0A5E6MNB7_9BACT|nr:DNA mismatch repair endonuclease MutL [Methylacidimicrobium cyclopophantes]VVM06924.1 DNA mismatch repair protein MutL [Methylacidimicrobium cyclopophantes]
MARKIRVLPEVLASQIAAGEVVERPASVVKELLENSLDAGATEIDIHTQGGGCALIEVADNGCGMGKEDALLCLERYATSKLGSFEELTRLRSYGFRGEALPTIASVSSFLLRTREEDDPVGTEVSVEAGKLISVREIGRDRGTTVQVRSLFSRLPARRRFLRSPAREQAHLQRQVMLAAMAQPGTAFRFRHGSRGEGTVWPSARSREDRLAAIFGEDWIEALLPLQANRPEISLTGFLSRPGIGKPSREEQFFFVNRRPVESRLISAALQEGYRHSLLRGLHPTVVLWLEIDPSRIDPNVHPAKREIRFREERELWSLVVEAVAQRLGRQPVVSFPEAAFPRSVSESPGACYESEGPTTAGLVGRIEAPHAPSVQAELAPLVDTGLAKSGKGPKIDGRPIGVVGSLYLLLESKEGLVVVDQHAAHERVLFERLLSIWESRESGGQPLLHPVVATVSAREAAALDEELPALRRLGLELKDLGGGTFAVEAVPARLASLDLVAFLQRLAADLAGRKGPCAIGGAEAEILAGIVCRRAVKARDRLSPEEVVRLLEDLRACRNPDSCPHGRPTWIELSYGELERRFGRVGSPAGCDPP